VIPSQTCQYCFHELVCRLCGQVQTQTIREHDWEMEEKDGPNGTVEYLFSCRKCDTIAHTRADFMKVRDGGCSGRV
jgi:hypothetical protein